MLKRIADLLEKFGIGSAIIVVYQSNWVAIISGLIQFAYAYS